MNTLFEIVQENSGATFSDCRKYRYALWRIWEKDLPLIMFIGLNPSTANESKNDRTISKVIKFAKSWGYGGVYMMNLFAVVSKDPSILKSDPDPVGDNDGWLERITPKCSTVVFAWGDFKEATKRSIEVIKMFPEAMALHINKNGTPKHPLYVRDDKQLVNFK